MVPFSERARGCWLQRERMITASVAVGHEASPFQARLVVIRIAQRFLSRAASWGAGSCGGFLGLLKS